jgi:hypothetical protein
MYKLFTTLWLSFLAASAFAGMVVVVTEGPAGEATVEVYDREGHGTTNDVTFHATVSQSGKSTFLTEVPTSTGHRTHYGRYVPDESAHPGPTDEDFSRGCKRCAE